MIFFSGVAHRLPGNGEDEERAGQLFVLRQKLQEEENEQRQVPGQVQRRLRSARLGNKRFVVCRFDFRNLIQHIYNVT
jgi:hypothetical protein